MSDEEKPKDPMKFPKDVLCPFYDQKESRCTIDGSKCYSALIYERCVMYWTQVHHKEEDE